MAPSDVLLRKLQYHSTIDTADVAAIRRLRCEIRELAAGEEFIRQGDRPKAAAIVIEGIMARYHTLQSGARRSTLRFIIQATGRTPRGYFLSTWIIRSAPWDAPWSVPFPMNSL